jgi:hypothetical protein
MSDGVKSASLEPVSGGPGLDLMEIAGGLIGTYHESLVGAEIRWFWVLERPLSFWGRARVLTEESWWLSGDKKTDRADISIWVNLALWKELTNAARKGLLDVLLSSVKRKEGGNTEMDTQDGTRLLYEVSKFSLGINAEALARNPKFVDEVDELKKLYQALTDPAQFLLDLQEPPKDKDEEDSREATITAAEESAPFYYYKQYEFPQVGRVTLRFTEADRRPSSLAGAYVGNEDGSNRAALEYSTDNATLIWAKKLLEDSLDEKMMEEIKAGLVDEQEWTVREEEPEEEEHGEVVQMRAKGGRRG